MQLKFLPKALRQFVKNLLGIQYLLDQNELLRKRLDALENKFYASADELHENSQKRWKSSSPGHDLTWVKAISGQNFIAAANRHNMFGKEKSILEIGPGYGRLLASLQDAELDYNSYLGVDISPNQVEFLTEKFADENHQFIQGDIQSIDLKQQFDTLISSLTFKHLFPSCKAALQNLNRFMINEGCLLIDFIEGGRRFFENDDVTYIREYSKEELTQLFEETGFVIKQFEQIEHCEGFTRLAVLAVKKVGDKES